MKATALDEVLRATFGDITDQELARRGVIGRGCLARIRAGQRPAPRVIRKLAAQLGGVSEHFVAEIIERTLLQAEARR